MEIGWQGGNSKRLEMLGVKMGDLGKAWFKVGDPSINWEQGDDRKPSESVKQGSLFVENLVPVRTMVFLL